MIRVPLCRYNTGKRRVRLTTIIPAGARGTTPSLPPIEHISLNDPKPETSFVIHRTWYHTSTYQGDMQARGYPQTLGTGIYIALAMQKRFLHMTSFDEILGLADFFFLSFSRVMSAKKYLAHVVYCTYGKHSYSLVLVA